MAAPSRFVENFMIAGTAAFPTHNNRALALANGQFDLSWTADRTKVVSFDTDVGITRFDADASPANSGVAIVPKSPVDNAESDGVLVTLGAVQAVAFVDRGEPGADGVVRVNFYTGEDFADPRGFQGNSVVVDRGGGDQFAPAMVGLAGGMLAVAYVDGASGEVRARVYDPAADRFTGESVVLGADPSPQYAGHYGFRLGMTALSGGGFAVSWLDGAGMSHLRLLDGAGAPITEAGTIACDADWISLAQVKDGRLVLFTEEEGELVLRAVDPVTGAATAPLMTGEMGCHPEVLALQDGRALLVWADDLDAIQGRIVAPDGTLSERFTIADTDGVLNRPALAELADGRVVVSYDDVATGGVYAAILDPRIAGVTVNGTEGADHYIGSGFDDRFLTGAGADRIEGGAGNDLIDGGAGADIMSGGAGDDTYVVDDAGDGTVELPDGGTDTVQALISWTLGAGVENLVLTGAGALSGTGNELANTITGNAGANDLDGRGGADRMIGGAGDDTYHVDDAGDAIEEGAGGGVDTVLSSISLVLGRHLENLTLEGAANLNGTGNGLANTLTGNAGANVLDGGRGADTLVGGAGDDTYHVDSAGDVVREAAGGGTDTVFSSVSLTLGDNLENLTLKGRGALNGTGNGLANTLTGNAGANALEGLGGADRLIGGAGDDTYLFVDRTDTVVEAKGGGNDSLVVADYSYRLAAGVEIESISSAFMGSRTVSLTGNEFGQSIYGSDGRNVLDGKGGADVLFGESRSDVFSFSTMLGAGNVDHVARFANVAGRTRVEDDSFRLSKSVFAGLSAGTLDDDAFTANAKGIATDACDRIVYETDTGNLFFDSNGSAAGGRTLFAVIDSLEGRLTAADFLVI